MKTKTTYIRIGILLIALTPVFVINAEDVSVSASVGITASTTGIAPIRKEIREVRKEGLKDIKDIRVEGRADIKAARSSSTSTTTKKEVRTEVRAEIKTQVDARRAQIKTQVDAIKAANKEAKEKKLDGKAKDRVQAQLDVIYKRLSEKLNGLAKVDIEVARRLAALSSASSTVSVDTIASLKTSYAASQELLTKTKIDVGLTKTAAVGEITATTTKEVLRGLVTETEASIKAAAESYKKLVESLKAAKPKGTLNATATAATAQ